jgi:hypothetical protein
MLLFTSKSYYFIHCLKYTRETQRTINIMLVGMLVLEENINSKYKKKMLIKILVLNTVELRG